MAEENGRITHLIHIIPKSPLLLGARRRDNYQETTEFIPGSVLRGAVAEKLLQACMDRHGQSHHDPCPDPDTCPFWTLFGEDEPYFGAAYPAQGPAGPSWPLPLTARTCKRHPGWTAAQDPEPTRAGHGIFDTLLADFAYGLVSDPAFPQRPLLQPDLGESPSPAWSPELRRAADQCPVCAESLKPAAQERRCRHYRWQDGLRPAFPLAKPRAVHVGINRARGVAEDALLFTQESLVARHQGDGFFAAVSVPAAKEAALQDALHDTFYVGRGRSRGQGEVSIGAAKWSDYPSLERRLADFHTAARRALLPYQDIDERVQTRIPGRLFTLTLRAPAILTGQGRPCRVPAPAALGLPPAVLPVRHWARMRQVGGWHSAAGLPRPTRAATVAGSVFLFYAPPAVDEGELTAVLGQIEQTGVGRERARGYGQVTVSAPVHTVRPASR